MLNIYVDYENGKYVTKEFTDKDREWFKKGYDYFNSLSVKRDTLQTHNENGYLKDYGFLSIEQYDNLSRGKQLQLDRGWDKAKEEHISNYIQEFLDL